MFSYVRFVRIAERLALSERSKQALRGVAAQGLRL